MVRKGIATPLPATAEAAVAGDPDQLPQRAEPRRGPRAGTREHWLSAVTLATTPRDRGFRLSLRDYGARRELGNRVDADPDTLDEWERK